MSAIDCGFIGAICGFLTLLLAYLADEAWSDGMYVTFLMLCALASILGGISIVLMLRAGEILLEGA